MYKLYSTLCPVRARLQESLSARQRTGERVTQCGPQDLGNRHGLSLQDCEGMNTFSAKGLKHSFIHTSNNFPLNGALFLRRP